MKIISRESTKEFEKIVVRKNYWFFTKNVSYIKMNQSDHIFRTNTSGEYFILGIIETCNAREMFHLPEN